MNIMRNTILLAFLLCFMCTLSFADKETDNGGAGRYKLYELKVDNVSTPVLLDTKTGKIWMYRFDSSSGRTAFVGMGVDGLVYVKKDVEQIDSQIQQWVADGILDKEVKNFRNMMINRFSYSLDAEEAVNINNKMKSHEKK